MNIFLVSYIGNTRPSHAFSSFEKAQEFISFQSKENNLEYGLADPLELDIPIEVFKEEKRIKDKLTLDIKNKYEELNSKYPNLDIPVKKYTSIIRIINYTFKKTIDFIVEYDATRISGHEKTDWVNITEEEAHNHLKKWNKLETFK